MAKETTAETEASTGEGDDSLEDSGPEMRPSRQQERDHAPDEFTTGYDPHGDTRVGIGSSEGETRKLIRHNEGRHRSDGHHSAREAARDKKRITQSFCSAMDLPTHQQREAVAAIAKLNLDRFGSQKRLEKVALTTIKVVVEWDRFQRRLQNVDLATLDEDRLPERMTEEEQYCSLLDQHGVSRKDLFSTSQLVKRELKKRNHFGAATEARSTPSESSTETGLTD